MWRQELWHSEWLKNIPRVIEFSINSSKNLTNKTGCCFFYVSNKHPPLYLLFIWSLKFRLLFMVPSQAAALKCCVEISWKRNHQYLGWQRVLGVAVCCTAGLNPYPIAGWIECWWHKGNIWRIAFCFYLMSLRKFGTERKLRETLESTWKALRKLRIPV